MDDTAQTIRLKLEVEIELKDGLELLGAMEAAKYLITEAKKLGTADGMVIFGRQKFPLR